MWVPFSSSGERIPMLSAMTLDQLGAKMVTINAASARSDTILQTRATRPGLFEAFGCPGPALSTIRFPYPRSLARIGIMRALNRGYVREFNPSHKDTHCGRRKLKRDE